ncbi:hypothetical protein D9756_010733 [Leucocoprinus leucothites]|uniref:Uncharacterized protein n=1 Tax=Leucocoprinus leucothites TaxID=201217 RepID=A0A8H5CUF4_9AGAR|nr:hypothetical protein D9756_010733 [Leucoagaricus leucothites]
MPEADLDRLTGMDRFFEATALRRWDRRDGDKQSGGFAVDRNFGNGASIQKRVKKGENERSEECRFSFKRRHYAYWPYS